MQEALLEKAWQESLDLKDPAAVWRKKAWQQFQEGGGIPKRKEESFQYVPLQKITVPSPASLPDIVPVEIEPFLFPECKHSYLVFVDGYFIPSASRIPEKLICQPVETALRTYGSFLQARFTKSLKEEKDPFALLNKAFTAKGAFLYVPPKIEDLPPLQIVQLFSRSCMSQPRLEIYVGRHSQLQILQTSLSLAADFLTNAGIEVTLDEGAQLSFYDAQSLPESALSFQSVRALCKRNSLLRMLSFTKGAKIARSSLRVQLFEENAEAFLGGLWTLEKERQAHVHALVEHLAPHTRSRQHFKGALKDTSVSSFEGKIFVKPIAQKTEAYQLNQNLLLSDQATANAKPNLEIFADDVKASHGATVAQLDAEQLFYLRSRGLGAQEANQWLLQGFLQEMIDLVPFASLKQHLLSQHR